MASKPLAVPLVSDYWQIFRGQEVFDKLIPRFDLQGLGGLSEVDLLDMCAQVQPLFVRLLSPSRFPLLTFSIGEVSRASIGYGHRGRRRCRDVHTPVVVRPSQARVAPQDQHPREFPRAC